MTSVLLRPRTDLGLPERLAASLRTVDRGAVMSTSEVEAWLADRRSAHSFAVDRIPLSALEGWGFEPGTGDLRHRSGRFFAVEGLSVEVDAGPEPQWDQPIIRQPEIGILGVLAAEIDGVLHFLLQAKMEPGNPNLVQLSPTVQATRSNYSRVHRGAPVRYLEYFTDRERGDVRVDVLQSEHGAWFAGKVNRNVLVEAREDVAAGEDFCWLTLGQIGALLRRDNVVSMDTRTVVACLPVPGSGETALGTDAELESWLAVERAHRDVAVRRIPLAQVRGWAEDGGEIRRADDRFFSVVGVAVRAGSREISRWTQPLFAPRHLGLAAFLVRVIAGETHLLVRACAEAGFLGGVELSPTVQTSPANWAHLPAERRPPFLDLVRAAAPGRIRYSAIHSEEGGRFLHAQSRYQLIEVGDEAPLDPPAGFRWVTPGQLAALTRRGPYVNVQARTLLACLLSGAAGRI